MCRFSSTSSAMSHCTVDYVLQHQSAGPGFKCFQTSIEAGILFTGLESQINLSENVNQKIWDFVSWPAVPDQPNLKLVPGNMAGMILTTSPVVCLLVYKKYADRTIYSIHLKARKRTPCFYFPHT